MILATSILHVHKYMETEVCQDCVEHVKHSAHISQAPIMHFDCVVCKTLHTNYLTPEVLTLSVAVLLVLSLVVIPVQEVVYRKETQPSLRAPPALC